MKSKIYWGEVRHWRAAPKEHTFNYPTFTFALSLAELESLQKPLLFALNHFALYSVHQKDYLADSALSIKEKLNLFLKEKGLSNPTKDILLLTMPRMFGYVFNPVSFYVGFNQQQQIDFVVTEVSNTFGERHLYLLQGEKPIYDFEKRFFVSPFFAVAGNYKLSVDQIDEQLSITVTLVKEGKTAFSAVLLGSALPFTTKSLLKTLVRYPLTPLIVMLRIYCEAFILYFRKAAQVYLKPTPVSKDTIRSRQNIIHRLRLALLAKLRNKGKDEHIR